MSEYFAVCHVKIMWIERGVLLMFCVICISGNKMTFFCMKLKESVHFSEIVTISLQDICVTQDKSKNGLFPSSLL
jgi:nitrate reductase gamma subunit